MSLFSPPAADPLVEPAWVAAYRADPRLRVLDARWTMPGMSPDAAERFAAGHIAGAIRFDIDAVADRDSGLPHMLPAPATFARMVGALGIGSDDVIVAYDETGGVMGAARAWWMFRAMGHRAVYVLDGGWEGWRAAGLPAGRGAAPVQSTRRFEAKAQPGWIADAEAVAAAIAAPAPAPGPALLDARPHARFLGETPEPRPHLKSGHMPGARSLPATELVDPATRKLLAPDQLRQRFTAAGIDPARPFVATCGSGVSAATLLLAAARLGHETGALYDGSWAEWGRIEDDRAVETGEAR